jgi:O-glycosyl hydrolase
MKLSGYKKTGILLMLMMILFFLTTPLEVISLSLSENKTSASGEAKATSAGDFQLSISEIGYQEIKGWGCFPYLYGSTLEALEKNVLKDEINNALYRDLGMTHVRVKIEPEDGNRDGSLNIAHMNSNVIKILDNVKKHNLKWFLTTWSPPAFMKTTGVTNGYIDTNGNSKWDEGEPKSYLDPAYEDAFIDYYIKAIKYLTDTRGFSKPEYVSIQNELNVPVKWDGCEYLPEDYQRIIKKFRKRFDEEGLSDIKLHGPESNTQKGVKDYLGGLNFPHLTQDNELNAALSGIAYHTYGSYLINNPANSGAYDKTSEDLRNSLLLFPEKDVWMTEWCVSTNYLPYYDLTTKKIAVRNTKTQQEGTLLAAHQLARNTVYIPCNYYNYWNGFTSHLDASSNWRQGLLFESNGSVIYSNIYNFHKLIFNNVRPGAKVHRLISDDPDLFTFNSNIVDAAAYVSKERTTVLLINQYDKTKSYSLNGISSKKIKIHRLVNNNQVLTSDLTSDENNSVKVELTPFSVNLIVIEHDNPSNVEIPAKNDAAEAFSVYPNPANDYVKLVRNPALDGNFSYHLYDNSGRMLDSNNISEAETLISMEHLSSGAYFLNIYDTYYQKVMTLRIAKLNH